MSAPLHDPGTAGGTLARMRATMNSWGALDQRAVFLRCYALMTVSMQDAIARDEFEDPAWVARLLDRFAGYYFEALVAYEQDPAATTWPWPSTSCSNPNGRR